MSGRNNRNNRPRSTTEYITENSLQDEVWIPRASDNNGHGLQLSTKVTPQVHRILVELTLDPRFPYRTPPDLVRHAIYRHMQWLNSLPGNIVTNIGQIMSMEMVCAIEEEHQMFDIVLDRLNVIILNLVNKDTIEAKAKAREILRKQLRYIQDMGDPYYQQEYTNKLHQQYSGIIEDMPTAGFSDMEDGPVDMDEVNQLLAENEAEMIDNGEVE